MANHCIDVICLNCGRSWCARGCGNDTPQPSQAAVDQWYKNAQEWADRYNKGKIHYTFCSTEKCPCGNPKVVMD